MNRSFAVSLASTLAVTTTGCTTSSDLVGSWGVRSYAVDGDIYALPYSYTEVDGNVTYTYLKGLRLDLKEDGRAAFVNYYQYSSSAGAESNEEYGYVATWEPGKGRSFTVLVEEEGIVMSCTADGDDMLCTGTIDYGAAEPSTTYYGGSYDNGPTGKVDLEMELVRLDAEE